MFNLEINGIGQSGGGAFNEVRVEGVGRLSGLVKCREFSIEGIGFAKEIECLENVSVEGVLNAKSLKANKVHVSGSCRVKEDMKVSLLSVEGYLSTTQTVKVDQARIEGKVKFKDGVQAETLNLTFVDHSTFDVIGATHLLIKRSLHSQFGYKSRHLSLRKKNCIFEGQLLEGEHIEVEYCHVKQIYGDVIKIGPGCIIEEIEYKEQLEIDPTSVVKVRRRV